MQYRNWLVRLAIAVGIGALSACGPSSPPSHVTVDDHYGSPSSGQSSASSPANHGSSPSAPTSVALCGPATVRIIELDQPVGPQQITVTVCVKSKNVWVASIGQNGDYRYFSLSPLLTDGEGSEVQATVPRGGKVAYLTDLDPKHAMCGQDLGAPAADKNGVYTISVADLSSKGHCAVIIPQVQ